MQTERGIMNKKLFLSSSILLISPLVSVISCNSSSAAELTEKQKYYADMQSWITNPKKFIIEAPVTGVKTNSELQAIEQATKYDYKRIGDASDFIEELGLSKYETVNRPDGLFIDYKISQRTPNVPMGMPYEYYIHIKCTISTGEIINFRHDTVLRSSDFAGQDTLDGINEQIIVNLPSEANKTYLQLKNFSQQYVDGKLVQNQNEATTFAQIIGLDSIVFEDIPEEYIVRFFIEEVEGIEYGQIGQFNLIVSIRLKHFEYMNSRKVYRMQSSDFKQRTDREVVQQVMSEIIVSESLVSKTYQELDAVELIGDYIQTINGLLGNPITIPSDLHGALLTYTLFANPRVIGERVFYDLDIKISKGLEWNLIELRIQSTNVYVEQEGNKYE